MLISDSTARIATKCICLFSQVFDNPPGVATLALGHTESDETTFITDVSPDGLPINTPDAYGILARLVGMAHDFSGARAYPLKTVLNIACVK
jgi:hypothetical protein